MSSDCGCDSSSGGLTPYPEALKNILKTAKPVEETESVVLTDALHRVLAAPLVSGINVPPANNSAMDGYAVNSADVSMSGEIRMEVSQRIPAGEVGTPLHRGTAARIFTGAPIPEGADVVIMQEHVNDEGNSIAFTGPYEPNTNIRFAGEDIARGDEILSSGKQLRAQELGVAASIGSSRLEVFKRVRVGVFFTGDELVEPGRALGPGQIYDSNRYTIIGLLKSLGCDIVDLGIIGDTFEATQQALQDASARADLVITSGGVSVGEEDYVRTAVESLGKLDMWRVKIKPGKPLAFGEVNNTPFMGLPGNPVSVFVTFCLFVNPFIKKLQGMSTTSSQSIPVQADFEWTAGNRREFVRAQLTRSQEGEAKAQIYPHQGSGVLTSTCWSDGLVVIPEGHSVKPGDWVDYTAYSSMSN
ncbi:MAG: molybdopterin molybdotransferase MoeA [Halieaceae bacterium]|jgi:molybdopterin molybdotransferase|nr:molybdopterin molybdotransferase MoeA [Halieaceae bacterium]